MPGYVHPTPIQRRVLEYIRETVRHQGRAPTHEEISRHFGWKSTNSARTHIRLLIKKGLLEKDGGLARGVRLPSGPPTSRPVREVPVLGRVAAGLPIEAVENPDGAVGVDAELFPDEALFALRVKGASMINAGIHEGDIALVRQVEEAEEGDIVVALVDGEATVKRFYRKPGGVVLRAENPLFPDRFISRGQEFSLAGVVVGLVRRFE